MEKHLLNPFASAAYSSVRGLFRSNDIYRRTTGWDEHAYFWLALQMVWNDLHHPSIRTCGDWNGLAATADDLTAALRSQRVPKSAIRPFGAHTLVTLDHISFVYRAKRYRNGPHLLVAPHMTGRSFSRCGHTLVHPYDSLADFAETMILLDKSVPAIREACQTALTDARKESAERAIKTPTAKSLLREIFGGDIPENVRFHVDGLRRADDLDVVRLEIRSTSGPSWYSRQVDVPLDLPAECRPGLADKILECDMPHAYVEPFLDDDTGQHFPILINASI